MSIGVPAYDNQISRFKAAQRHAGAMQVGHVLPHDRVDSVIAFDRQSGVGIGPVDALDSSLDGDNLILVEVDVSVMRLQGHAENHYSTWCRNGNSGFHVSSRLIRKRCSRALQKSTKIVVSSLTTSVYDAISGEPVS
jgi:hypothetical protein